MVTEDGVIPNGIMRRILSGYRLPVMGIHGVPHWGRVLENGARLAARTGADAAVVSLFSVFHDARRRSEGHDPEHGRRGAALASQLAPLLGLTDPQLEQLVHACAHHADGTTQGDATVQTCWDADRLDLWRVGITPGARWLCTDAARDAAMLEWARVRSIGDHFPGCAAAWLQEIHPAE